MIRSLFLLLSSARSVTEEATTRALKCTKDHGQERRGIRFRIGRELLCHFHDGRPEGQREACITDLKNMVLLVWGRDGYLFEYSEITLRLSTRWNLESQPYERIRHRNRPPRKIRRLMPIARSPCSSRRRRHPRPPPPPPIRHARSTRTSMAKEALSRQKTAECVRAALRDLARAGNQDSNLSPSTISTTTSPDCAADTDTD